MKFIQQSKKLPPLLYTTDEGRRVYEFHAIVNKRKIVEIHIDPHYEEEHGDYMNDEIIYNFAFELEKEEMWKSEDRDDEWECYSVYPLFRDDWRAYEMPWCLKDGANFVGIISCYRRRKYDREH